MNIEKPLPVNVNKDLLSEQLRLSFEQVTVSNDICIVHNVLAEDEATIDAILAAHVHTDLSTEEQQDTEDNVAFNDFQSVVSAALSQIDSDEITLQNATTFAELKPLLANMMVRDRKTIRALAGLIRKLS